MNPHISSRCIFRKWCVPKHVTSEDSRSTESQLQECSTASLPLPIELHNPIVDDPGDDQVPLQDQVKPEDCATAATVSHFIFLPYELWEGIIDNLSDDQDALHACSLTCRALLHASRYHIFHSVCLESQRQARRFLDGVCLSGSSASPCTYVRYLYMSEGEGYIRSYPFVNEILPLLATYLPNVTELELNDLKWMILNDAARAKILSGFPKVKKIKVWALFNTSQQANEFISSFPSLTTLTCWKTSWRLYSEPVTPLPRSLKFIVLCSDQSNFFDQLLRLESHPDVSTVCFKRMYSRDTQAMGEMLKTLGSRLEHLEFGDMDDMASITAGALCDNHINLAHNTNLHSVCLDNSTKNTPPSLECVSTLFSQITSHHVEYVSLPIVIRSVYKLEEMAWASMERVLTQQHWSNLRLLEMIVFGNINIERRVPGLIKACLPILDSRGIVRVANWYDRNFDDSKVFSDGF